jgi:hypothetical protein
MPTTAWFRFEPENTLMRHPLSLEAFASWCEKQPADKAYEWEDPFRCACSQYASSLGFLDRWIGSGKEGFWYKADRIAGNHGLGRTFGALASRLRAASQP